MSDEPVYRMLGVLCMIYGAFILLLMLIPNGVGGRLCFLFVAAIGIAIGAGIAAALPATELEADYLGEASDAAKAKASDLAADQTDRVISVAENVATAVKEEARKQGLTMEGAKSAAGDISAKVGRVVEAAGKGVSERVTLLKP